MQLLHPLVAANMLGSDDEVSVAPPPAEQTLLSFADLPPGWTHAEAEAKAVEAVMSGWDDYDILGVDAHANVCAIENRI